MQAERKLGRLLETTDRAKPGDNQWSSDGTTTTLNDLGISRDQSHRFQAEASPPEGRFCLHRAWTDVTV